MDWLTSSRRGGTVTPDLIKFTGDCSFVFGVSTGTTTIALDALFFSNKVWNALHEKAHAKRSETIIVLASACTP